MSNTLEAIEENTICLTPSQASRLARHYLGLAHLFREIAGELPREVTEQARSERDARFGGQQNIKNTR